MRGPVRSIAGLAFKIKHFLKREDRQDSLFRIALVQSQVGDLARYVTHDASLNPRARPVGSRKDEQTICGQALMQLLMYFASRGFKLEEVVELGLQNQSGQDWAKVQATPSSDGRLMGTVACPGEVVAQAYVVGPEHKLSDFPAGWVLVISSARPDYVEEIARAAAVVTDNGGITSHAATIARDKNVPCLVGTGEATTQITHGRYVVVQATYKSGGRSMRGFVKHDQRRKK